MRRLSVLIAVSVIALLNMPTQWNTFDELRSGESAVASDSPIENSTVPSRLADRLSIILRGVPATQQERDKINAGQTVTF